MEIEEQPISSYDFLLLFLRTLAEEERLKIAGLLALEPRNLSELSRDSGMNPREPLPQLRQLIDAGLVQETTDRNQPIYELNCSLLQEMKTQILSQRQDPDLELDDEQKVLRTYLRDGRLNSLLAQQQRREILFRWLATHFESGITYHESEVNTVLRQYHPDFALLRRELIDRGFMTRDHGMYKRVNLDIV